MPLLRERVHHGIVVHLVASDSCDGTCRPTLQLEINGESWEKDDHLGESAGSLTVTVRQRVVLLSLEAL